jgi:hypothetical protein
MKKTVLIAVLLGSAAILLSAQTAGSQSDVSRIRSETSIDASRIGIDSAQQKLKEVSISKFEDAGFWTVSMPLDQGLVSHQRVEGAPAGKSPIEEEAAVGLDESDQYTLGVKVNFFRRGPASFAIQPVRPLPVEGIVKTVSVWVIGRNYNHELKLLVEDFFGRKAELSMGKLNFSGWKQMQVSIPPTVVQRDYHYNNNMGIKILGFLVDCDLTETYGTYYIYFDDLRAVTDLFAEESRDPDDIQDIW